MRLKKEHLNETIQKHWNKTGFQHLVAIFLTPECQRVLFHLQTCYSKCTEAAPDPVADDAHPAALKDIKKGSTPPQVLITILGQPAAMHLLLLLLLNIVTLL